VNPATSKPLLGQASYTLSEAEWLEAYRVHAGKFRYPWISMSLLLLAVVCYWDWVRSGMKTGTYAFVVGYAAIVMIVISVINQLYFRLYKLPHYVKRVHMEQEKGPYETRISWTEDTLTIQTSQGRVSADWKDFFKRREQESYLLLYRTEASFYPIPKRAVPTEMLASLQARLRIIPLDPA
jgi:hypothetical protein